MGGPDAERAREEAVRWLVLLEDDPDDPGRRAAFRAWLAAAPANEAAWRSVARTGRVLARAERERAADRSSTRSVQGWHWVFRPQPLLAAVVVACLIAALSPMLVLRLQADHATGTAELSSLRLDDGTSVRLGPASALRVDFFPDERRVRLLSGEALFDVASDPARPFRVITRDATTTVLGTRFGVVQLADGTSITVARGRVGVAAAASGSSFDLRPGDWVRVGADGTADKGTGLPDHLLEGPGPRLAVRNRPVAEVVERLRPWFAGRILIADDGVGQKPVTGVFHAADPHAALEAIVGPQGGRVIRVTPWLLIVSKG